MYIYIHIYHYTHTYLSRMLEKYVVVHSQFLIGYPTCGRTIVSQSTISWNQHATIYNPCMTESWIWKTIVCVFHYLKKTCVYTRSHTCIWHERSRENRFENTRINNHDASLTKCTWTCIWRHVHVDDEQDIYMQTEERAEWIAIMCVCVYVYVCVDVFVCVVWRVHVCVCVCLHLWALVCLF